MSRVDELVQVVMDVIEDRFEPDAPMTPDSTLDQIGIDSLEVIELILLLEEKLPTADLDGYAPELSESIRQIATEIEKRSES